LLPGSISRLFSMFYESASHHGRRFLGLGEFAASELRTFGRRPYNAASVQAGQQNKDARDKRTSSSTTDVELSMTLPEVWARVPVGSRTDRTKVLVALFSLDAHPDGQWLRATDVVTHIKVQLGKKAVPTNINQTLRQAGPLVELKTGDTDGKLLWRLSATGVKSLSDDGIVDTAPTGSAGATGVAGKCDVAIVCAIRKPELMAVFAAFGGQSAWEKIDAPSMSNMCYAHQFPTMAGGDIRLVATCASSMGLTSAAIVSTNLIYSFRPTLLLMIGIAAGTEASGRNYGDILVADPSVDYRSGKVANRAGKKEFLPDQYPIPLGPQLRSVLQSYKGATDPFSDIKTAWPDVAPTSALDIHIGPVGTGDQVVDDIDTIRGVQKGWRKLIGLEMESYGLYRAAHEAQPAPLFVAMKAVSDFAQKKSDNWQEYAAYTAASFAQYFLFRHWHELNH
jgi:nucleoside phosphorylase